MVRAGDQTMKKCSYCGYDNDDNAIRCRSCGTGDFKQPTGTAAVPAALPPRRFVLVRKIVNVVFVLLTFMVIVPNCIVAATPTTPLHLAWVGLIPAFVISGIFTFCLWCWR